MATGIIGAHQHHAAVYAGISETEQRIGRHIDADHLHRGQRTRAEYGGAGGGFQSNFFIRRPFGNDIGLELGNVLENFSAGSPRISAGIQYAGFPGSLRNRFVSRQ